jgi:F0F1-type ATP synthase membrane subunit c/vacuolar-type H+-ATPase subunit K
VFTTFCISLALFGVVLAFLYPSAPPTDPPTVLVGGLLLWGAIGVLLTPRIEKPLNCTDDSTLASSYRTRFFLRIAFAQAAALFGFVGFFLTYEWWTYPVGVAIAAVGFYRAAPTREHLRQDQERLAGTSCFRPLVHALRTSMQPRA